MVNQDMDNPVSDYDAEDFANFYVEADSLKLDDFSQLSEFIPLPLEDLAVDVSQQLEPIFALFQDLDQNRADILEIFRVGFNSELEQPLTEAGLADNQGREYIYSHQQSNQKLRLRDDIYYRSSSFTAEELALYQQLTKSHHNPQSAEDLALLIVNEIRFCITRGLEFISHLQQYLEKFYQNLLDNTSHLNKDLEAKISEKLYYCTRKIDSPLFHFALQNRSAGLSCGFELSYHIIGFNLKTMQDNGWNFVKDIITHEFAHWLEHVYFMLMPTGSVVDNGLDHRSIWYRLSEIVFNHSPTQYNAYDSSKLYEETDFSKSKTYYFYWDKVENRGFISLNKLKDEDRYLLNRKAVLALKDVHNFAYSRGTMTISGDKTLIYPQDFADLRDYRLRLK